jgi:alkylhydroperoxidase family enzyme
MTMLDKVRALLAAFFGDTPNQGVTTPALRRAVEAQAREISIDERLAAWRLATAQAAALRRTAEQQAAHLANADGQRDAPAATEVPADLAAYIRKVTLHAHRITDRDVNSLKQAGYSEDALFEITISAAVGAATTRLEAGLASLAQEEDKDAS